MVNEVYKKVITWMSYQDPFPPKIHVNPILLQEWGKEVDILDNIGCVIIPNISIDNYELREM